MFDYRNIFFSHPCKSPVKNMAVFFFLLGDLVPVLLHSENGNEDAGLHAVKRMKTKSQKTVSANSTPRSDEMPLPNNAPPSAIVPLMSAASPCKSRP